MNEYGVFTDEGCLDRQLWSRGEAERAVARYVADGEDAADLRVFQMCTEHDEQAAVECEYCYAEEDAAGEDDEDA